MSESPLRGDTQPFSRSGTEFNVRFSGSRTYIYIIIINIATKHAVAVDPIQADHVLHPAVVYVQDRTAVRRDAARGVHRLDRSVRFGRFQEIDRLELMVAGVLAMGDRLDLVPIRVGVGAVVVYSTSAPVVEVLGKLVPKSYLFGSSAVSI